MIDAIVAKMADGIDDIRLKDLERMTFALMLYNFIPPSRPDIFQVRLIFFGLHG